MPDEQTNPPPNSHTSEIETYAPKPILPAEPSQELLSVLVKGLNAQIEAGDHSAIDKIIELQAGFNKNEQALRVQEQTLRVQRESRLDRESQGQTTTTRLLIGAITLAFAGSLGYGFIHKDTGLADKIFTGAMGLLGGAGGLALSQKKSKDPN
jgi:hypothetical protein